MAKLDCDISIPKHWSNHWVLLARFKKCLVYNTFFGIYSLALFHSLGITGNSLDFNQYNFSSHSNSNNLCNKIFYK